MHRSSRRRRWTIALLAVVDLAVFLGGQTRFFLRPWSDPPQRVDALVVLGPARSQGRLATAEAVAARFPGAVVLLSNPERIRCPKATAGVARIVCFTPIPGTTQGEARYAARYATDHGLHRLGVVTTDDQLLRARLRFSRCWHGELRMFLAPISLPAALDRVVYQNAAMVKAELLQRSC